MCFPRQLWLISVAISRGAHLVSSCYCHFKHVALTELVNLVVKSKWLNLLDVNKNIVKSLGSDIDKVRDVSRKREHFFLF